MSTTPPIWRQVESYDSFTKHDPAHICVVSGGFDPVHSGHVYMFSHARRYGGALIAGLNSDEWLTRKKGKPFMNFDERREVVGAIRFVDSVLDFDDSDDTACDLIRKTCELYPNSYIVFCNGGDRDWSNIPEMDVFHDNPQVQWKFGVGGSHKAQSSSTLLSDWSGIHV